MKKYRFYKEDNDNWYVDLPDWKGAKSDLLMIGGADTMLDILSKNGTEVNAIISEDKFEGADELVYKSSAVKEFGEGSFYVLEKYKGNTLNLSVFLCDVCKWVFGCFPEQIYIKTIE